MANTTRRMECPSCHRTVSATFTTHTKQRMAQVKVKPHPLNAKVPDVLCTRSDKSLPVMEWPDWALHLLGT